MLVTNNEAAHHGGSFERSIIFIPKWLDKRVETFSKNTKTLKSIDGLLSILIPADVDFYLRQVSAISSHPALRPYFQSFNVFSHADAASWGANISSQKAAKKYNEIMGILNRASAANTPSAYSPELTPLDSYVDKNAPMPVTSDQQIMDRAELAGILGVDQNDPDVDLYNLRVVLSALDADTLVIRLETIDPDQNRISQILQQTEANIKKITQYYEFSKVMASPIGKYYNRLVLTAPNM